MSLFDRLRGKKQDTVTQTISPRESGRCVLSPVDGTVITLEKVSDQVFSSGALGKGCGIIPTGDVVYAPVSGTLTSIGAPNYHVVGIKADDGAEVLIHVGVDTFDLNGAGFETSAKQEDHVEAGTPVLSFSREKIEKAGHDPVVIMVLTNTDDLSNVEVVAQGEICHGSPAVQYKA